MNIDERSRFLLERAQSEPRSVLEDGRSVLGEVVDDDSRAVALRAMAIAARNVGSIDESVELAEEAAGIARDGVVRREALATLAGAMATRGEIPRALG
ncbi:MAG: hypothetical protein KDB69_09715, partial [Acidimicrobiia bacterium]|nr:hypothetical protein [Acidimicrobiia bacterium]